MNEGDTAKSWAEANQCCVVSALAVLKARLEGYVAVCRNESAHQDSLNAALQAWRAAHEAISAPSAVGQLRTAFGLSPFEQDILLLTAGMELDSSFAALCARAQGDARKDYPTFSLALAALPEAHWSALSPARPLRHWRLIEVSAGVNLTTSQLRIDERILHFLAGVGHLDERLSGLTEPVPEPERLVSSHAALADQIVAALGQADGRSVLPLIQLLGIELVSKQSVTAAVCASLGLSPRVMSGLSIPLSAADLENFARLWTREAILSGTALLLDCHDLDATDVARGQAVKRLTESVRGPIFVASPVRRPAGSRQWLTFEVGVPTAREQREIWESALGENSAALNGDLDQLVSQFRLASSSIHAAAAEALTQSVVDAPASEADFSRALWTACRAHARPRLDDLAQTIEPRAAWEDLVLPEPQVHTLGEIAMHVRQRSRVYEAWGFAEKSARGLGISALFTGASGTGKTMAAEVLANELRLDLYRIDLSQVVSKYIGETEKNLRRVFDAAEEGGAILLFDEADALFGKRSEVKDSHDRYANIEVSYLLQRMEAYRGLAILTTNLKGGLDTAFQRRIRFVVQFPFPGLEDRARIWQRIFPADTPTENLNISRLARLNVAGGNIRNIALNAAFRAADAHEPVGMIHLLHAARSECAKMEKPLTEAETGAWV
jgi:hypothetical protein